MRTRWPGIVIALAAASFLTALAGAQSSVQPPPEDAYTGSASCQRCHEPEHESWSRTLHVQMTKPIAEARVEGDFRSGTRLQQNGRAYAMEMRDSRYYITVTNGKRTPETFEVNYTLGARRFQGYLSKLPDGRIYVLPVFWHNETKRWIDWKEITPVPDDPDHDLRQIWNVTCVNCHATNIVKNFNPSTNSYATTWTEMGVGCEACHGPGRDHVALMDEWERNPPSRRADADIKIFSQGRATPRQNFDACGYCHGNKNNAFYGFRPGDRYEDFALPFLISQPIPDNDPQGDFWPDGRPSRFNRPQALSESGCFRSGEASCVSCHKIHGAGNDHALKVPVENADGTRTRASDTLCTQCHTDRAGRAGGAGEAGRPGAASAAKAIPDVAAHTHHAVDSQGSRCVECHMSDVNWRLLNRRRDHTFQPPVPEMTMKYGVPNACTTCHEDKSPEWAAATMDRWYGNGDRRRSVVTMADAIYRAGTGDANALPAMTSLALDRSHGMLVRASAAEFAGQLIVRAGKAGGAGTAGGAGGSAALSSSVINSLIGASADPEPSVRVMAVRALGLTGDRRAAPVLAAHLKDETRLVRVSAAEGLMTIGVTELDGAAGDALRRAQEEWATSLRTFNDDAADQITVGWLDAVRGKTEEAVSELQAAIAIDPADPKPNVYLGMIAARQSKYDEALRYFTIAKKLAPSYQNLDRLIEEVRKR